MRKRQEEGHGEEEEAKAGEPSATACVAHLSMLVLVKNEHLAATGCRDSSSSPS
jgi:hypothetical protein